MKWYKPLYQGQEARKQKLKLLMRVSKRKYQKDVFLITLPANADNVLDIIEAKQLLMPWYNKKEIKDKIHIIGIAKGKSEAYEVVRTIVDEVYHQSGGFNVAEYLGIAVEKE